MSGLDDRSLLALFVWLSPAFPVGAFAYSHGVESAVDAGLIHDAATLETWIGDLLGFGSARQGAVLAAEAWRRVDAEPADLDAALAELTTSRWRWRRRVSGGSKLVPPGEPSRRRSVPPGPAPT